jgi:hypothetical protein
MNRVFRLVRNRASGQWVPVATPYGVGSDDNASNNTGNAPRRDTKVANGNRHLTDFTGRLALTLVGGGVRLPTGITE